MAVDLGMSPPRNTISTSPPILYQYQLAQELPMSRDIYFSLEHFSVRQTKQHTIMEMALTITTYNGEARSITNSGVNAKRLSALSPLCNRAMQPCITAAQHLNMAK
jgi:hypothetical protein